MQSEPQVSVIRQIPRSVWVLGCVSLFMDISSEMIHSLLPMFLVASLGASAGALGFIEGMAEATAQIVKVFSGTLSDYLGNRKWLAVAGYSLGALSKPLFAVAPTVGVVVTARIMDRVGKGIRGAPRDALIADVTPPPLRGAAFGLRQSLDTIAYRWEHTDDWTARELGIAVHADAVRIHPFVDGNGRATRLLANLVYFAAQESPDNLLTYDWDVEKRPYIDLLREYDQTRDPVRLAAFIPVVDVR